MVIITDDLKIQKEIIEFPPDPALGEEKERLVREQNEKEKKARRRKKWRRILRLGFFSKK